MNSKLKKGICITLVTLMLTGCGSIPQLKDGSDLVVKMNGLTISADKFYEELKDTYGTYALVNMIDETLLNEVYETTSELEEKVDAQILTMKNNYGSDFNDAIYSYYGVSTEAQLRDYITMAYKRQMGAEDYAKTLIDDDAIESYYETKTIGDIKASHILIIPDATDDMTAEEKTKAEEAALKTAKEIIKKLDDGEDFAALAKEYSDDSSASDGGNLGYFNRGEMVSAFENAAISLKVGEYTDEPVKTDYGYHIILKTNQKAKPELKDVKEDIIDTLVSSTVSNTANIYAYAMEWLRNENNLEIYDSDLKVKYEHYMNEQKTASTDTSTNN